jgi:hypothetical protein
LGLLEAAMLDAADANRSSAINFSYEAVETMFPSLGAEFIHTWSSVCTNYNIPTTKSMWKMTTEVQSKVAAAIAFDQAKTKEDRELIKQNDFAKVCSLTDCFLWMVFVSCLLDK